MQFRQRKKSDGIPSIQKNAKCKPPSHMDHSTGDSKMTLKWRLVGIPTWVLELLVKSASFSIIPNLKTSLRGCDNIASKGSYKEADGTLWTLKDVAAFEKQEKRVPP